MDWSRKKADLLNILGTRFRSLSSNRSKNRNSYLAVDSHLRIPIILNTVNVTQSSTQTLSPYHNNNAEHVKSHGSTRQKSGRRKYQHRFNRCLAELTEKYPPIPAHEYLKDERSLNDDSKKSCYSSLSTSSVPRDLLSALKSDLCLDSDLTSCIWSKLLESREDLSRLNRTLEDLDKRLERLSLNMCSKCKLKHAF